MRLKRIPVLSKLTISGNSLLLVVLGFMFAGHSPYEVPGAYVAFFLILATLAMNFIDLKDWLGDCQCGIKTLPVLFGMKRAQRVVAAFWLAAHLAFAMMVPTRWLAVAVCLAGVVQAVLLCRKKYSERPVFAVYLITLLLVIVVMHGAS